MFISGKLRLPDAITKDVIGGAVGDKVQNVVGFVGKSAGDKADNVVE